MREALRWLFIAEIILQPIMGTWLVIIALRIRRDQARIQQFVDIWADRMATTTMLPRPRATDTDV